MDKKICTLCDIEKDITEYGIIKKKETKTLYRGYCKTCQKAQNKRYYENLKTTNPEKCKTLYGMTFEGKRGRKNKPKPEPEEVNEVKSA